MVAIDGTEDDDRLAVGKEYQGSIITRVKETRKTLVNGLIKVRKEISLKGGMIMIEDSYVQPEEKKEEAKPKKSKKSKRAKEEKEAAAAAAASTDSATPSATTSSSLPTTATASNGTVSSSSTTKPSKRASLKRAPTGGSSSGRQKLGDKGQRTSILSSMDSILDKPEQEATTPKSKKAEEPTKVPEQSPTKTSKSRKSVTDSMSPKASSKPKVATTPKSPRNKEFNKPPLRKSSSDQAPKITPVVAGAAPVSSSEEDENVEAKRRASDTTGKKGFSKIMNAWGARSSKKRSSGNRKFAQLQKSTTRSEASIDELPDDPRARVTRSTSKDSLDDDDDPEFVRKLKNLNNSSSASLSHSFSSLANKSNSSNSNSSLQMEDDEDAEAAERLRREAEMARQEAEEAAAKQRAAVEAAERARAEAAEATERVRKAAAERAKQEAERLAAEKAEADRIAAEKASKDAADRIAAEKAAKAEADRLAAEKAEAERLAAEKAEADRLAAEKAAEAERLAAEKLSKTEAERLAMEKATKEEAERLAAEKSAREEAERLAAEKAAKEEAERLAAEQLQKEAEEKAAKEAAMKQKLEEEEKQRKAVEKAKKDAADKLRREEQEKLRKAEEKQRKKEEKANKKAQSPSKLPPPADPTPPPVEQEMKKHKKVDPAPGFATIKGAWDKNAATKAPPTPGTGRRTNPVKLHNLCASKLEDGEPFHAPVHEKSFEDKKLIRRSIEDNFMFKNLPEADLEPLVAAFEKVEYEQGETIIEQGDRGVFFYVIQDGEVSFNVNGEAVGGGTKGDTFGDSALVYSMPRNTSVKSVRNDTVIFRVGNTNFRHMMKASTLKNEDERTKLLQSVPFFKKVDEYDLKQLSAAMTPYSFRKGENLGDTFKKTPFCLIQRGSVQATDTDSGNKKAKIGPGGSFGADSLAKPESSMANVVALSDGDALTIDRETFEKIFGNVARLAIKSVDKQTLSLVKAVKDEEPTDIELDTLVRQVSEVKYRKDRHLFYRDTETGPTLYMVRRGRVKITTRDGKEDIITAGGYFGDEFLLVKRKNPLTPLPLKVKAKCTAVTMEETVCGLLTLQEFRSVLNHKLSEVNEEQEDEEIEIDDLEKHRILGEGLFGQVWLVTNKHVEEKEPYALKIQQTSDPHRPHAVADIRSEIKMMRHLSYPFIIEVLNVFEEETCISMLLSLAPGGELFDIIHHQNDEGNWVSGIGEKKGRFYAAVVADTLGFMHRRKYVFRDLKPENVLIDKDGYPVLTDFGFTKRVTDKTFTFCGTPNYLPPEIVANRGHGISADNWSLGVLIYELIEGENPFFYEGMDQMALFESICNDTYYPIEEKTSKESVDLIDRLLEKDPNQRLGTFREKDILDHKFFKYIDMKKLRERKIEAPWKPGPVELEKEEMDDD